MNLSIGDYGVEVSGIQDHLNTIGYCCGKVDGLFGEKTEKEVKKFQRDARLLADGIVGHNTLNAMKNIGVYSMAIDAGIYISDNFKVKEFACKDGSNIVVVDTYFVKNVLQKIRDYFKSHVVITSAFRTKSHNEKVGGAPNSWHLKGRAFDIIVRGVEPEKVAYKAQELGAYGILIYNNFVHIDNRNTKLFKWIN